MVASWWEYRFVTICGLAIIAFASAAACSGPKTETLNETGKHETSPGLTGVWKSDGYGFVLVVRGSLPNADCSSRAILVRRSTGSATLAMRHARCAGMSSIE